MPLFIPSINMHGLGAGKYGMITCRRMFAELVMLLEKFLTASPLR
jgi:hypothetical protein